MPLAFQPYSVNGDKNIRIYNVGSGEGTISAMARIHDSPKFELGSWSLVYVSRRNFCTEQNKMQHASGYGVSARNQ